MALLSGQDRNCNASEVNGLAGATDTAFGSSRRPSPTSLTSDRSRQTRGPDAGSRITNADNQLIATAKLALPKLQLRVPRPEQLSCRLPRLFPRAVHQLGGAIAAHARPKERQGAQKQFGNLGQHHWGHVTAGVTESDNESGTKPGYAARRSPRSPCPEVVRRFALRRRSEASDRPRSSISEDRPLRVRRPKNVAFRDFNNSRLSEAWPFEEERRLREALLRFVAMAGAWSNADASGSALMVPHPAAPAGCGFRARITAWTGREVPCRSDLASRRDRYPRGGGLRTGPRPSVTLARSAVRWPALRR